MLTIYLSANKLCVTLARSVEAAGNNEPPSGTNGLQVRREAQDFRRRDVKVVSLADVGSRVVAVFSMWAESPKRNCQP